jgi:adenine-specific DNA glycosylase
VTTSSGLLAGLFEPPSILVDAGPQTQERRSQLRDYVLSLFPAESSMEDLQDSNNYSYLHDYGHVFSHIKMTYHVHRIHVGSPAPPSLSSAGATETTWLDMDEIAAANITTGTKNILKALYDPSQLQDTKAKKVAPARKPKAKAAQTVPGAKITKVVRMPGT